MREYCFSRWYRAEVVEVVASRGDTFADGCVSQEGLDIDWAYVVVGEGVTTNEIVLKARKSIIQDEGGETSTKHEIYLSWDGNGTGPNDLRKLNENVELVQSRMRKVTHPSRGKLPSRPSSHAPPDGSPTPCLEMRFPL